MKRRFISIIFLLTNFYLILYADDIKGYIKMSDGINLYYEVTGEGSPVLLIHGGDVYTFKKPYSSSSFKGLSSWEPQVQEISKNYRVIKFDIRGFGKSKVSGVHPIDSWSWKELEDRTVTDVVELLKNLDIQNTNVIGLSIGSGIAAQFSVFHPELIDKLILVSPWRGHTFTFFSDKQKKNIESLHDKTLLIIGGNDRSAITEANNAKRLGYNPQREIINNAGHFVNSDKPNVFNKLVLGFLKE